MTKNRIAKILMNRDGLTAKESDALITETMKEMDDALADEEFWRAEDIFTENLGLELDYIFDLLI